MDVYEYPLGSDPTGELAKRRAALEKDPVEVESSEMVVRLFRIGQSLLPNSRFLRFSGVPVRTPVSELRARAQAEAGPEWTADIVGSMADLRQLYPGALEAAESQGWEGVPWVAPPAPGYTLPDNSQLPGTLDPDEIWQPVEQFPGVGRRAAFQDFLHGEGIRSGGGANVAERAFSNRYGGALGMAADIRNAVGDMPSLAGGGGFNDEGTNAFATLLGSMGGLGDVRGTVTSAFDRLRNLSPAQLGELEPNSSELTRLTNLMGGLENVDDLVNMFLAGSRISPSLQRYAPSGTDLAARFAQRGGGRLQHPNFADYIATSLTPRQISNPQEF